MNRKIKVNYTIVVNVDVDETIERICAWHKAHLSGQNMKDYVLDEIKHYQLNMLKV